MTETSPSFACQYQLTLAEAKEGFALATFGKKKMTRFVTPLISVAIIIWGFSLGVQGDGKFYVALGATFFILQLLLRLVFLPRMFSRQYYRAKMDQIQQGIYLYQSHLVIEAGGNQKDFPYTDIINFMQGENTYTLEFSNKMVIIVSKAAVVQTGQQQFFESVFNKR